MSSFLLNRIAAVALAASLLPHAVRAVDANHDGMDDAWQTLYNIAPFTGAADPDGDGRPNLAEALNWTNPTDAAHPNAGWGGVQIMDVNGDHVDDHWTARYFPQGMVMSALTTPLASTPANGIFSDPDGDGRTNLEESIVFSDPFVADWPWGSPNGTPSASSGPGAFTLTFRSKPAMSYLIERSVDLSIWGLEPDVQKRQVWGDGGMKAVTLDTGTAQRMFFRTRLDLTDGGPLDSDGDGINDWQELFVFQTNRFATDSDGDGIKDAEEIAEGTNPTDAASNSGYVPGVLDAWTYRSFPITGSGSGPVTAADSDGDGLPDAWEMASFDGLYRNGRHDADDDGVTDVEEAALAASAPQLWDSVATGRRDLPTGSSLGAGALVLSSDGRAGQALAR